MNTIYLQTYFVTIACILGTGILGLPVTLYKSGFYPFLVDFILAFFMQVLVIIVVVEILQKAYAIQVRYEKENQETANTNENKPQPNSSGSSTEVNSESKNNQHSETKPLNSQRRKGNSQVFQKLSSLVDFIFRKIELLPLKEMEEDTCDELEDQAENGGPVLAGHVILSKQNGIRSPDLHLLGEMFLCFGIRQFFDIIILLELVTMLIAYSLAGSEAYGEILGIKYIYVIPVFTWCLAFLIVFAVNLIQPLVSILTLFKASLFTMAVIVTFFVTSEVQLEAKNNFNYIQDSLLMSTVALGGIFFVMPFLFVKIEKDAPQILKYRLAVIMGLVTCTILNILWCWAVIDIVPQHCPSEVGTNHSLADHDKCYSLLSAKENGQISTEPLTKIIYEKHRKFIWVAVVVEVFIVISITVSYLTLGTAMYHIICGIVESMFPSCALSKYSSEPKRNGNLARRCSSVFISLFLFGLVFLIAILNPKGFLDVMEKFSSSSMNLINIFFFFMFLRTRNKENKKVKIQLPLPNKVIPFLYLIPLYFGFTIVYDVYFSIIPYLNHKIGNSHLTPKVFPSHNETLFSNVTSPHP